MNRRMGAKRMEQAVGAYFARCDGTRERVPQKGGGSLERQVPYTLYGLCAAVSLAPEEVLSAAHGQGDAAGTVSVSSSGQLFNLGQSDDSATRGVVVKSNGILTIGSEDLFASGSALDGDGYFSNSGHVSIYNESGDTGYWKLYAQAPRPNSSTGSAGYAGSFATSDVSNFLVELWNADGSRAGWQSYSASSVANSIWQGSNPTSQTGATALVVSAVVPEPTSGMLLMLGGALLALRRRRRVIA